ncbi:MAG TPA: hypothetical protein VGJ05_21275 [Fimbriiglobus sp.]|jgi:hypothetical protein
MNDLGTAEISVLIGVFGFLILLVVPVAYQAYRRGYNPIIWGIVGLLTFNPLFPLIILAMVPHRSRLRLRDQFTRELEAKLAARVGSKSRPTSESGSPRTETSTVGDQVTELPQNRSIGDDQTRL